MVNILVLHLYIKTVCIIACHFLRLNPNDCLTVNPFSHENYKSRTADDIDGITWPSFEGMSNSLKSVVWMVRPQGKNAENEGVKWHGSFAKASWNCYKIITQYWVFKILYPIKN